jgi:hypothetical protein
LSPECNLVAVAALLRSPTVQFGYALRKLSSEVVH